MQRLPDVFLYCPKCGRSAESSGKNPFHCAACHFKFFFGPTVAVGAIVADDQGRILFLKRARNPGLGKYGIPGGFVDEGESTEDALIREVREETNLKVESLRYLATFPNSYPYQGVLYPVADIFYECHVTGYDTIALQAGEVDGYLFCHPTEKELDNMAFVSNRRAVEIYLQSRREKHRVTR